MIRESFKRDKNTRKVFTEWKRTGGRANIRAARADRREKSRLARKAARKERMGE